MFALLRARPIIGRFFFAEGPRLKLERFDFEDIKLMCELLKTKYFKFNEELQIFRDVRLLDEKGKVIGLYTPVQAKKKVEQLKKDLVLINEDSTPIICKALPFKEEIVRRFYQERVLKNKDEILNKRSRTKQIKMTPNMSNTDMKVKVMQIIETIKKQAQVEIIMRAPKVDDEDKIRQKMETVKSMLGSNVRIIRDVSDKVEELKVDQEQEVEEEEEEESEEEEEEGSNRRPKTFRLLVESSKDEYKKKVDAILKENPEDAIKKFLSRYIDQDDQEMRELNFEIQAAEKLIGRDLGGKAEQDEQPKQGEQGEEETKQAEREKRRARLQLVADEHERQMGELLAQQKELEAKFAKQYRFQQRVKKLLQA